jgi:hypothetical protein
LGYSKENFRTAELSHNVSCFSFRRVRRRADEHGNEKKKVIKRNGKGNMLE